MTRESRGSSAAERGASSARVPKADGSCAQTSSRGAWLSVFAMLALASPGISRAQFTYADPGTLMAPSGGAPRVGAGRVDRNVYAPGMLFPMEGLAWANSQIYGYGGYMGPGGGQCDSRNYRYPWYDNYCEERSWEMPLCPGGRGHQGQDIRPETCRDKAHWAVAATDGMITSIGTYSVYLTADDGTRYDYLHMDPATLAVSRGQRVRRGQRLGLVSDAFGSSSTSIHLHFNIRKFVAGVGTVYAPTYMSLIESYREHIGAATPDWRAEYVNQTFPLASRPFELAPGDEVEGYLEMRNTGAQTWRPGEVFLGTSNPRDATSAIASAGWVSGNRAATVDRVVAPGETGRFVFTVRAPDAPGDYPQFFNLLRETVAWFSDGGGPRDDILQVRVTVVAPACPAGLGEAWACEGTERRRCAGGTLERETCAMGCGDGVCLEAPRDDDGDGHNSSVDCDDARADVFPGAVETCGDSVDQDCDGSDPACDGDDGGVSRVDAGVRDDAGEATLPDDVRTVKGGCAAGGGGAELSGLVGLLLLARRRRARAPRRAS
jgi:murein DD-endopeptidase MepM/ murein hydrolase activator NlpD